MVFYYFKQIKQIENELNIMQNKPKMQLTFGFYCQKMHLKIIKNMINMTLNMRFITPPHVSFARLEQNLNANLSNERLTNQAT